MSDIYSLSISALAEKIRSKEISCIQVASKFIENIEKHANLNALINFDKECALKEAAQLDKELELGKNCGRLHGVPLVIKDNIHVKDIPNTAGCPGLKDFVPKEDAPTVKALRDQGALILAKTNMHELAFGTTSKNEYYGYVKCAHNTDCCAGGSSGGTGAAIASKQAPAGLGSDTGGSVRIPSAINGIFGLRPTTGRYSQKGVTPLSFTRDTVGPMGNFCEDLELIDEIITGETCNEKPILNELKIGIPKGYLCDDLDPEVEAAYEHSKSLFVKNGIQLVEIDMNEIKTLDNELGISIIFYETPIVITNYLKNNNIDMNLNELFNKIASPDVKTLFESHVLENSPQSIKKEEYERCINLIRPQLIQAYRHLFEKYQIDLLAYPSLPCLPIKFDEITNIGILSVMVRNNNPTSNAGIPSLTIPIAKSANGLPIGLHLDALFNRDQYLLKCGTLIHKLF